MRTTYIDGIKVTYVTPQERIRLLEKDLKREQNYLRVADGYDAECAKIKIEDIKRELAETKIWYNKIVETREFK